MGNINPIPYLQSTSSDKSSNKNNGLYKMSSDNIIDNILKEYVNKSNNMNNIDNKMIILATYNTIVKAYFVEFIYKPCPFSRPRLLVQGEEHKYKRPQILYPSISELETFHIDELTQFYQIYKDFTIYVGIYDDPHLSIKNKVYKLLPHVNKSMIFNIYQQDKNFYETLAIDFSTRFEGNPEPCIIINSDSHNTILSVKHQTKWVVEKINIGFSAMNNILNKDYDERGEPISIIKRLTNIESIILKEINKIDENIDFKSINDFHYANIVITGTLAKTFNKNQFNKYKYNDSLISIITDEINNYCWTTEPINNMYSFYYHLGNMVLLLEILKYLTANINKKISVSSKLILDNNNTDISGSWIKGKVLFDNKIYKF